MQIDFDAIIRDLDGNPVRNGEKDMTLGTVAAAALLQPYQDEQNLAADDKVKRFRLAEKAVDGGTHEIKAEDVVTLKRVINKMYGPLIVARAYDIIEPPKPEVEQKAAA